jgi:hypothetical protein
MNEAVLQAIEEHALTPEAIEQVIHLQAASLQPVPRLAPAVIENRLAEWRRLLRQSTTQGRTVLQRILRGRADVHAPIQ